jgi:hypothetical protein
MPDPHDPAALVRHAAQAGDWRLVHLIMRVLRGHSGAHSTAADRAYATLVLRLDLAGDRCDYHRR